MSDKVNMPLSKETKETNGKLGSFRVHKDYNNDDVHIHDDKTKMVFRTKGIQNFEFAIRSFLNSPSFNTGTELMYRGNDSATGRGIPCHLCLIRKKRKWVARLVEMGTMHDNVIFVHEVIVELAAAVETDKGKIGPMYFFKDYDKKQISIESTASSTAPYNGLHFVMDIRKFELAVSSFISGIGHYDYSYGATAETTVLFPGDKPSADLVFCHSQHHWIAALYEAKTCEADIVFGCDVLNELDEIVQA